LSRIAPLAGNLGRHVMIQPRHPLRLIVLAVVAGGGLGTAAGALPRGPSPARAHTARGYETSTVDLFRSARRVASAPFALEQLPVVGHGGTAVVEWSVGSWSGVA